MAPALDNVITGVDCPCRKRDGVYHSWDEGANYSFCFSLAIYQMTSGLVRHASEGISSSLKHKLILLLLYCFEKRARDLA